MQIIYLFSPSFFSILDFYFIPFMIFSFRIDNASEPIDIILPTGLHPSENELIAIPVETSPWRD